MLISFSEIVIFSNSPIELYVGTKLHKPLKVLNDFEEVLTPKLPLNLKIIRTLYSLDYLF